MFIILSHWVVQVFIVIVVTLLIALMQKLVMQSLHRRLLKTKRFWDNALVDALQLPLHLFIWLIGLVFAARIIEAKTNASIFAFFLPSLQYVGTIFLIAWFFIRFVKRAEENILTTHPHVDLTTADAISKVLSISIIITAGLAILQFLGVSIAGVLAFGGIGGLAIGFAAKDLLANFFGGLILYLDRPFSVGEMICSPDRQIEGFVEQIGWRLTRIRTLEKRSLYVPNSLFNTIVIENPSRMTHRRIRETIGLRYSDMDQIVSVLAETRKMLKMHPKIDQDQLQLVHFNEFNTSSLDFFIHAFTTTTSLAEFHQIKEEILLKVYQIIQSHGADMAFPTRTVHLASSPTGS